MKIFNKIYTNFHRFLKYSLIYFSEKFNINFKMKIVYVYMLKIY